MRSMRPAKRVFCRLLLLAQIAIALLSAEDCTEQNKVSLYTYCDATGCFQCDVAGCVTQDGTPAGSARFCRATAPLAATAAAGPVRRSCTAKTG